MASKRRSDEGRPRRRKSRRRRAAVIEFEDRSSEEFQDMVAEVQAALLWVQQQRERGNLPN